MSGSAGTERLSSVVAHALDWTGTALPTPIAASWVLAWAAGGWLRASRQDWESLRGELTVAYRTPEGAVHQHSTSHARPGRTQADVCPEMPVWLLRDVQPVLESRQSYPLWPIGQCPAQITLAWTLERSTACPCSASRLT